MIYSKIYLILIEMADESLDLQMIFLGPCEAIDLQAKLG